MALNLSNEYDLVDSKPFDWNEDGSIRLWIRPQTTNEEWQKAMTAFSRWEQARRQGSRRGVQDASIEEEKVRRMKDAAAKYLIDRWEGVVDVDTGERVEYTPDRGLELMNDPKSGESFLADVLMISGNVTAFRQKVLEEAAGNSAELSDTGEPSESSTPKTSAMHAVG